MGRPMTTELAKQIVRDRNKGMSHRQIAIRYGITKAQSQSVIYRTKRGERVGTGGGRPWAVDELDALKAMADAWVSVDDMSRTLHRSEDRVRAKLKDLRGVAYVRPKEILKAERQANLQAVKVEYIARRRNDDLAHCTAIMEADCEGSPKGCGFPVASSRPTYRVAA